MKINHHFSRSNLWAIVYLSAVLAANFSVALWGPSVSIVNAFLFIGLTLTTRDYLHDAWGDNLKRNMAALILAGAVLSAVGGAGRIALASAVAFALSESVDAVVYALMHRFPKLARQNGSNVPSAMIDSFVFPAIAFGFPVLWWVVAGQFAAKVAGGALWSVMIHYSRKWVVA